VFKRSKTNPHHTKLSFTTKNYIFSYTRRIYPVSVFDLSTGPRHTIEAEQRVKVGMSPNSVCCGTSKNLC